MPAFTQKKINAVKEYHRKFPIELEMLDLDFIPID